MLALHCTPGTHSPCFDEQSMRPDISYNGLLSSLVSGLVLQQQWSPVSEPSGTIELSFFGFGAPQAAEIAIKATKVRMAWW